MKRLLLMAAWLPIAPAAQAELLRAPLPPPIASTAPVSQRTLLAWIPGEVRCDGQVVAAIPIRRPWNTLLWGQIATLKPVAYGFAIDETGRTLSIRRTTTDSIPFADDIAPTLAATRFAGGAPHAACTLTYTPHQTPVAQTQVEDLISYSLNPRSGTLPPEGWARIRTSGTCLDEPRPQPLTQVFPDFRTIPGTPGVRDWSMIDYDTDAAGRPTRARLSYGTGNAALDAAALKAIRASRYTGGARTGCRYPYWHAPEKLPAPAMPARESERSDAATCPSPRNWATQPVLRFPEAYRRRSIEGWAVVAYDIAPWGETGNVRVLAAQPSEDFGQQAIQVVRGARHVPSTQGATGCVDRVKFVMGPLGGVLTNEAPPPPPPPFD